MAKKSRAQRRTARLADARGAADRVKGLRAQLRRVEEELVQLAETGEPSSRERVQRQEALRRRRTALRFEVEKWQAIGQKRRERSRGTKVQGPKGGVRTIVQAGAPGLGKRA